MLIPVISRKSWVISYHYLNSSWQVVLLPGGGGGFPDQERKIPGNLEIPEVFSARKSLKSQPGFPVGDSDH
jgi:hypothetical protein